MDPKVDAYLERATRWRDEMASLRAIALQSGLQEELKWGKPCYRVKSGNVAIIQPFKDHCAFMFFKGALLDDPEGLLEAPGPHSRSARRMMFTSVDEIVAAEPRLRLFLIAAIEVETSGEQVEATEEPEPIPAELEAKFQEVAGLEEAFYSLTPGRQRAYLIHFSSAKQAKTRTARIEKHVPRILEGKGMND